MGAIACYRGDESCINAPKQKVLVELGGVGAVEVEEFFEARGEGVGFDENIKGCEVEVVDFPKAHQKS